MSEKENLYLGFDLSTQQLKGAVVNSTLELQHNVIVDFDLDLPHYGTKKGVLTNATSEEIYTEVALWFEAFDLVLERLKEDGLDFSRLKGVSGAGMQHGTVFWGPDALQCLGNLDPKQSLRQQLIRDDLEILSHPFSPNWQDTSTQEQCDAFDARLGGPQRLAEVTGSSAHHRFSGPQILRFRQTHPDRYAKTSRISLVSSFIASVFLGRIASIDISDVCGMNLWDIPNQTWHDGLLRLASGSSSSSSSPSQSAAAVTDLKLKLGDVATAPSRPLGTICPYYTHRYNIPSDCRIVSCTGDNPATILALPLRASDAIVSLGTSTTFLMSTAEYRPDPAYHLMSHPTTPGLYMFMLCYKNGALARERVRDALASSAKTLSESEKGEGEEVGSSREGPWDRFNDVVTSSPPTGRPTESENEERMKIGIYFPRPEIVPKTRAGTWRALYDPITESLQQISVSTADSSREPQRQESSPWDVPADDVRAILESQFLSIRLRSAPLVQTQRVITGDCDSTLPAQPRRIYLVGGGSVNPAIARVCGEVLGGAEGVFRLDSSNACAMGAAYKAVWVVESGQDERFEDFVGEMWREEDFVKRVDEGYREERWGKYGIAMKGLERLERTVADGAEGR